MDRYRAVGNRTQARTAEALLREPVQVMLSTPENDPWYTYTHLEAEIKQTDKNSTEQSRYSIEARWRFGQALLAQRVAGERGAGALSLPVGLLDQLVEQCQVSRAELKLRMAFAERYPDELELVNAVNQFKTWHGVVNKGLRKPEATLERPAASSSSAPAATLTAPKVVKFLHALQDTGPQEFSDAAVAEIIQTLESLLLLFQSYHASPPTPPRLRSL